MAIGQGSEQPVNKTEDKSFLARVTAFLKGDKQQSTDIVDTLEHEDVQPLAPLSLDEADATFVRSGGTKEEFETLRELRGREPDSKSYRDQAARLKRAMDRAEGAGGVEAGVVSGAKNERAQKTPVEIESQKVEIARGAVDTLSHDAQARVEAVASPETRKSFGEFWKSAGTFFKLEGKDQLKKTLASAVGVTAMFLVPGVGALMGPVALAAALGSRGGEIATRAIQFFGNGKERSARMAIEVSQQQLEVFRRDEAQILRELARVPGDPKSPERAGIVAALQKELAARGREAEKVIELIKKQENDAAGITEMNRKIASRVGMVAGLLAGGLEAGHVLQAGVNLDLDHNGISHLTQWGKDGLQWLNPVGHAFSWGGAHPIVLGAGAALVGALPSLVDFGNKTMARSGVSRESFKGITSGPAEMTTKDSKAELDGCPDFVKNAAPVVEGKKVVQRTPEELAAINKKIDEELERAKEGKKMPQEALGVTVVGGQEVVPVKNIEVKGRKRFPSGDELLAAPTAIEGRALIAGVIGIKAENIGTVANFIRSVRDWIKNTTNEKQLKYFQLFLKTGEVKNALSTDKNGDAILREDGVNLLRELATARLEALKNTEDGSNDDVSSKEDGGVEKENNKDFPTGEELIKITTPIEGRERIAHILGIDSSLAKNHEKFVDAMKSWVGNAEDPAAIKALDAFLLDNVRPLTDMKKGASTIYIDATAGIRRVIADRLQAIESAPASVASDEAEKAVGSGMVETATDTKERRPLKLLTYSEIKNSSAATLRGMILDRIGKRGEDTTVSKKIFNERVSEWSRGADKENIASFHDFLKAAHEISKDLFANEDSNENRDKSRLLNSEEYSELKVDAKTDVANGEIAKAIDKEVIAAKSDETDNAVDKNVAKATGAKKGKNATGPLARNGSGKHWAVWK